MAYAKCYTVLTLLKKKGIKEIRRMETEEARRLLGQYPVNAKKYKQFDGLEGQQLIKANKKHKMPILSPESVKDYIQKCSSFFEWCGHIKEAAKGWPLSVTGSQQLKV
ncbi:hypothetical protein C9I89_18805 [Photobacterium lipolyticum]|uniref:Uncharacterized protein n=2 Tax=Photobacterium lipolyticum TaxID=266810 RepID=A0A2T3MTJ0_9GAMM|nr:hypothetical protein C9I89_18805 [Photobacterium lipolyticum]